MTTATWYDLGPLGRLAWRIVSGACALLLAATVSGCDRCAGTEACGDPHVNAQGRLFWHLDAEPAGGVRVEFVADDSAVIPDTITTVSAPDGSFTLTGDAGGADAIVGRITFYPPEPYSQFPFTVGAFGCRCCRCAAI